MSRILIIDDEPSIRQVMARVLGCHGHVTIEAADGVEGAALLRANPVDLVITDLIMPGGEGIETIIGMRRDNPAIPVIAMSGTIDAHCNLRMAQLLGARRTLQKPFTAEGLLKAIDGVLRAVGREVAPSADAAAARVDCSDSRTGGAAESCASPGSAPTATPASLCHDDLHTGRSLEYTTAVC